MVCKSKIKGKNGKYGMKKLANPWLKHVASERKKYPKLAYKDVLVKAKKNYTPLVKKK